MESLVNNVDLFMLMRRELDSLSDSAGLCNHLKETLSLELDEENSVKLSKFCQKFCWRISSKWKQCNRSLTRFLKKNKTWLDTPIAWTHLGTVESEQLNSDDCEPSHNEDMPSTSKSQAPSEDFNETQKRRLDTLKKPQSLEEITFMLKSLKRRGNEVASLIDHLLEHPEDMQKAKAFIAGETSAPKPVTITPEKALELVESIKLSKWQYNILRESANEQGHEIYPSYDEVKQAKMKRIRDNCETEHSASSLHDSDSE